MSSLVQAALQGKIRLASTEDLAISGSGNLRMLLKNATVSDTGAALSKTVALLRMGVFATTTGWAELVVNPTGGLPPTSARQTRMTSLIKASMPVIPTAPTVDDPVDFRADVSGTRMTGGSAVGVTFGIPGNSRLDLDMPPFVIDSGASLGINIRFGGSTTVGVAVYWMTT